MSILGMREAEKVQWLIAVSLFLSGHWSVERAIIRDSVGIQRCRVSDTPCMSTATTGQWPSSEFSTADSGALHGHESFILVPKDGSRFPNPNANRLLRKNGKREVRFVFRCLRLWARVCVCVVDVDSEWTGRRQSGNLLLYRQWQPAWRCSAGCRSQHPHLMIRIYLSLKMNRCSNQGFKKIYTHPFFKITFRMDCFIFTVFPKMLVFF